jgi:hypothetical protein
MSDEARASEWMKLNRGRRAGGVTAVGHKEPGRGVGGLCSKAANLWTRNGGGHSEGKALGEGGGALSCARGGVGWEGSLLLDKGVAMSVA